LGGVMCVLDEILKRQKIELGASQKDQFISMLAHDLRTPLTAIRSTAELVRRHHGNGAPQIVKSMNTIVRMVERADAMIKDLLDFSRLQTGKAHPVDRAPGDLREIVMQAVYEAIAIHGARFELLAPEPIPGNWSAECLRRAIENLCTNAIKYGDPTARIRVSLLRKRNRAVITVQNQGEPIPRAVRPRLFLPFQQGKALPGGDRCPGWGIGLALVRAVTEAHEGRVRLRSTRAGGTFFFVILPLRP
ncbi:MAG: HAMP domain-containing histidine kinase, partial [Oligoflexia bacterium]|nr:HAMP domain-containing histidine kinase [Oligoflexia bacterium]